MGQKSKIYSNTTEKDFTMMTNKHTPTPWYPADTHENGAEGIYSDNGDTVLIFFDGHEHFANRNNNSKFILEAVNNHERLKKKAEMFDELYQALFCADKWMQQGNKPEDMWKGANNLVARALRKAKQLTKENATLSEKAAEEVIK